RKALLEPGPRSIAVEVLALFPHLDVPRVADPRQECSRRLAIGRGAGKLAESVQISRAEAIQRFTIDEPLFDAVPGDSVPLVGLGAAIELADLPRDMAIDD